MQVVASEFGKRGGHVESPRSVTDVEITRIHDADYLTSIKETAGRAVALDPDTFTSPGSFSAAYLAAGAAVTAVEHVLDSDAGTRALAMVRPPGHHAERNRAMGFCLFNNIAIAAASARARGLSRVAVVDYDVHHGNGTQHIFEEDPHVLYVSTHQFPYYPGTGAAGEVGRGAGSAFTVNLPLEVGSVDEDYQVAFSAVILPVLAQFKPDLIIVSAGFDAHERDPLAGMRLSTDAFAAMTAELRGVAEQHCQGRMAVVTEGGYDLQALAASLDAVAETLNGSPPSARWPRSGVASDRGRAAVAAATRALSPHWRF